MYKCKFITDITHIQKGYKQDLIAVLRYKCIPYENFKRHKIKDHSNMFRIVFDPSSGSIKLYLT